ncbi:STM3941 family protein [Priestia koreensis]|uniref:STM3941 family protein n=1 Tax=Priestia koreensis TaxID=284581 RepID=UPI0028F6EBFB|nr:STM3941 family protein [Priestia koreensis]
MKEFIFYRSKWKVVLLGVIVLAAEALFGFMIVDELTYSDGITGYLILGVVMFLLLLWVLAKWGKIILSTQPFLIMTEKELTIFTSPSEPFTFKMSDVEGLLPYEVSNVPMFGIILVDEEKYYRIAPKTTKRIANINHRTGFPTFNVALNMMKRQDREKFLVALSELEIDILVPEENAKAQ